MCPAPARASVWCGGLCPRAYSTHFEALGTGLNRPQQASCALANSILTLTVCYHVAILREVFVGNTGGSGGCHPLPQDRNALILFDAPDGQQREVRRASSPGMISHRSAVSEVELTAISSPDPRGRS